MTSVLILSGGMDSSVLAYRYAEQDDRVIALSFDYGQRHRIELQAAAVVAGLVGAEHHVVDLSDLGGLLHGSALTDPRVDVPFGHYAAPTMVATVVPNRNAIMLSVAIGVAVAEDAYRVGTAVHAGDHPVYPDCRPEFIVAMGQAARVGNAGLIRRDFYVDAPFVDRSKADIVREGFRLGVPFETTWSCYQGGDVHCGKCGTCVERREAFDLAGIDDPTEYA